MTGGVIGPVWVYPGTLPRVQPAYGGRDGQAAGGVEHAMGRSLSSIPCVVVETPRHLEHRSCEMQGEIPLGAEGVHPERRWSSSDG